MEVTKCIRCKNDISKDLDVCPFCGFSAGVGDDVVPRLRVVKRIPYDIEAKRLKSVYLNREGKVVGGIYAVGGAYPILAYLSWRTKEHYYIKSRGFGIQRSILKSILDRTMFPMGEIKMVIIKYDGVRGRRYFVSKPDDWIMHGEPICYTKEIDENIIETYGDQTVLCQDFMEEWVVDKRA